MEYALLSSLTSPKIVSSKSKTSSPSMTLRTLLSSCKREGRSATISSHFIYFLLLSLVKGNRSSKNPWCGEIQYFSSTGSGLIFVLCSTCGPVMEVLFISALTLSFIFALYMLKIHGHLVCVTVIISDGGFFASERRWKVTASAHREKK